MRSAKSWKACGAAFALLGSGCDFFQHIFQSPLLEPAPACGSFDLKLDCSGDQVCFKLLCAAIPGPRATLTFDFNPQQCDRSCSCNQIAMVQALRLKRPDKSDIAISDSQSARTIHSAQEPILDGWAIDRDDNGTDWLWGYYERNDNGSFDSNVSVGSDSSPTRLTDSPGTSVEKSYTVEVLDVPVCIDEDSACRYRALGYYAWGWTVSNSSLQRAPLCESGHGWTDVCGSVPPELCQRMPLAKSGVAIVYYRKAFCLALKAWNANRGPRHEFPAELIDDACAGF